MVSSWLMSWDRLFATGNDSGCNWAIFFGYKFHPGTSKPVAWIHICSRSRKPSSGRQWQDQQAMAMDQNWDYTKGPTKHGWCLLFSIKPFIFCGWYLFSGPCPTPWYPPTTTSVSRKSQPLETWMPVRHCQFAIQGHWKPPKARSCHWPSPDEMWTFNDQMDGSKNHLGLEQPWDRWLGPHIAYAPSWIMWQAAQAAQKNNWGSQEIIKPRKTFLANSTNPSFFLGGGWIVLSHPHVISVTTA